jgi:NADPH-dependent curcumin reductase
MTVRNRRVLLASRPQGAVTEQNFRIVDASLPEPADGEVLVKNEWLSLDPYMRGRMSDAKSYVPPAQLDEVMVGQTVGEVIGSRNAKINVGDKVLTQLGWQSHGIAKAADVTKVDARRVAASCYLGILGMPGLTAWFGLFEIGQPKAGETVLVSAASGAVGSVVGQLAKVAAARESGRRRHVFWIRPIDSGFVPPGRPIRSLLYFQPKEQHASDCSAQRHCTSTR